MVNRPFLTDSELDTALAHWLKEDVGEGDVTTEATVQKSTLATASFRAKASGVLSGTTVAARVFRLLDPMIVVRWEVTDGNRVQKGDVIGTVSGPARAILTGERLALNLLQRMSGIATATAAMVDACAPHKARILDTRKTVPGLRALDKIAVLDGGGTNHRMGLYDMILIKDNHIAAAGGIEKAVSAANGFRRRSDRPDLEIELETRTFEEVRVGASLQAVDRLLLDNMARITNGGVDTSMLKEAVDIVGGRKQTEASGNVTLETVAAIASTGVDYISSGSLTHSVTALDITLLIDLETGWRS